jgi:hypothetical protein
MLCEGEKAELKGRPGEHSNERMARLRIDWTPEGKRYIKD